MQIVSICMKYQALFSEKKKRKKLNVVSQETMLQISLRSFKNDSNEMSSALYWEKKIRKNNLNCYLPIFSGLFKA